MATRFFPGLSDQHDEFYRAQILGEQTPDVQAQRQILLLRDGNKVRHLHWNGNAWQCDCTYSRTHSLDADPCRHVRALEQWTRQGQIPAPRLMILDPTLFTRGRKAFIQDSSCQTAHEAVSELWRDLAQDYARRQTGWTIEQIEDWYTVVVLGLICPHIWLAGLLGSWELHATLDHLSSDLPDWFDTLREIKRTWIALLKEPNWETNLAFKEAFCDWLEEEAQAIADSRVRNRVCQIGKLIRHDRWSPYVWDVPIAQTRIPCLVPAAA